MKALRDIPYIGAFPLTLPQGEAEVEYQVLSNHPRDGKEHIFFSVSFQSARVVTVHWNFEATRIELFSEIVDGLFSPYSPDFECGSGIYSSTPVPLAIPKTVLQSLLQDIAGEVTAEILAKKLSPDHREFAIQRFLKQTEEYLRSTRLQIRHLLDAVLEAEQRKLALSAMLLPQKSPTSI